MDDRSICRDRRRPSRRRLIGALALMLSVATANAAERPGRLSYSRVELDASGASTVGEFLRQRSFNSFGSRRSARALDVEGQALELLDMYGIGPGYAQILLDGHPLPSSADLSLGQNLLALPLAMIERIEVNRLGDVVRHGGAAAASVNLISRAGISGVELEVGASRPSKSGADGEQAHALFGIQGERGQLIFGASSTQRDLIELNTPGLSTYSNNLLDALPEYQYPPGQPPSLRYRPGGFVRHPQWGSSVPNACQGPGYSLSAPSSSAARCIYDFRAGDADEVDLRQAGLWASGTYGINEDWQLEFAGLASRVQSFAPSNAPLVSAPLLLDIDSPSHPFRYTGDPIYSATQPYFLRHRLVGAAQSTSSDERLHHVTLELVGEWRALDLRAGLQSSEAHRIALGRGFPVNALVQDAIASGRYDIYQPFANSQEVVDSLVTTVAGEARSQERRLHLEVAQETALWRWDAGIELDQQDYRRQLDRLVLNGPFYFRDAVADRLTRAVYGNLGWQPIEPLRLHAGLRLEHQQRNGPEQAINLSIEYRLNSEWHLFVGWNRGFRRPELATDGRQPVFSRDGIVDRSICPPPTGQIDECGPLQYDVWTVANPALAAEQLRALHVGVSWHPSESLEVGLQAYDHRIGDRIRTLSSFELVQCNQGLIDCPPGVGLLPPGLRQPDPSAGLGLWRDPSTGIAQFIQTGAVNSGEIRTRGIEWSLGQRIVFASGSEWMQRMDVGYVDHYSVSGGPRSWYQALERSNLVGLLGRPRWRATLDQSLSSGDWCFSWNIAYLHGSQSGAGQAFILYRDDGGLPHRTASSSVHNLQISWEASARSRLTLGVLDIGDRGAEADPLDNNGRDYNFALYDGRGRTPYLRFTQHF